MTTKDEKVRTTREILDIKVKGSTLVDFADLTVVPDGEDGNVREAWNYHIPEMVDSIRKRGFLANHPLTVNRRKDGTTVVLCGNRRATALQVIRDASEEEFMRILPKGKVPCVVFSGLTAEEEIIIRNDHAEDIDRIKLGDWGLFLAVKQLLRLDMTQAECAAHLGLFNKDGSPNRSVIQQRANLARLPVFMQAEYEKLCKDGKDSTAVRWGDVSKLYKAFAAEYRNFPDGDGPELRKVWDGIVNPPAKSDSSEQPAKALSPTKAVDLGGSLSSSNLKKALLAATQQGPFTLVELDATMVAAETALNDLNAIAAYLGDEGFADLMEKARSFAAAASAEETVPVHDPASEESDG